MKSLSAIGIALATATQCVHSSPEQERFRFDDKFDAYTEELLEQFHVPAISIAVVQGGAVSAKGYGYARIPSSRATAETLYYAGSTTKAFVAAAAARMVQSNHTSFDDWEWSTPLAHLLEGNFALAGEYESLHTTLEDALSHRSGLPRHDIAYGWANASTIDNVRRMRYLPLTAEPRTKFQYCNLMFAAVGAAIERATGSQLDEVLADWLWRPLGMASTGFVASQPEKLARGYFWEGGHYVPEQYMDIKRGLAGAGATISSVKDYALWIKALLDASDGKSSAGVVSPIISRELWEAVTASRSIVDSPTLDPMTYALGWVVGRVGNRTFVAVAGRINARPRASRDCQALRVSLPEQRSASVTPPVKVPPPIVAVEFLGCTRTKLSFPSEIPIA